MQISRIIISCFLLFTYSLGFAHYLIPHCEASNIDHQVAAHQENPHHHHEHHQHTSDEKDVVHEDIVHNGHLDAGLYDLILCFLSDAEHPTNDCNLQHYLLAKTNDNIDTKLAKSRFVALLFVAFCITDQDEQIPESNSERAVAYLSPPIEDPPHRGPPSLSC